MSHFTKMSVDYKGQYEPELLMAIEEAMGVKPEVHENPVSLLDYTGRASDKNTGTMKAEKCHIVLRQDNLPGTTNDCGWRRTEEGGYEAFLDTTGVSEAKQGLISQSYALAVAEKKFKAEGYSVTRKQGQHGRIQLEAVKY